MWWRDENAGNLKSCTPCELLGKCQFKKKQNIDRISILKKNNIYIFAARLYVELGCGAASNALEWLCRRRCDAMIGFIPSASASLSLSLSLYFVYNILLFYFCWLLPACGEKRSIDPADRGGIVYFKYILYIYMYQVLLLSVCLYIWNLQIDTDIYTI